MESIFGRLTRIFIRYSVKIISLLLAVSILAFILVDASPIDPVQQYILSLGAAVSPEPVVLDTLDKRLLDIIQAVIFLFFAAEQFLAGYRH